jgi:uncharacterized protein (TIRG00374 family)
VTVDEPEVAPAPRRPALTRSLAIVMFVALALYIVFALYLDLHAVTREVSRVSWRAVLLGLLFATLSFAVRFGRWHYLLGELGVQPPVSQSALIFTSGLGLSITPGKAGELLKVFMMRQAVGASVAVTAPVVVAERVGDLFALLVLAASAVAPGLWGIATGLCAAALVTAGSLVLSSQRLASRLVDLVTRWPRARPWRERLLAASATFTTMFAPRRFLVCLGLGCAAWLIHCAAFAVIARDMLSDGFSFHAAILANAAPLLLGAAAMVPGGLGIAELSMAGVILAFAPDATKATAGAVTFVVRLATLWWAVGLGVCALVVWQLSGASTRKLRDASIRE